MDLEQKLFFNRSNFSKYLIHINALDKKDFREWVFYPDMLFNAQHKWWGNKGKRENPHEGLDLCFYRNEKEILRLDETTKVPTIYDGTIVKIINDLLGKSIIIEHLFRGNTRLLSIYAHIIPCKGIYPSVAVREGDIIATVAGAAGSKSGIYPHLHVSAGLASEDLSYENLEWGTIGRAESFKLIDPLKFLDLKYTVLQKPEV